MDEMTGGTGDLAALIASRICHDLISPLGAIGNGVELLALDGGLGSPELALVAESVEGASARIRFFRIAFGAAEPGVAVPAGELAPVLAALGKGGRIDYAWSVPGSVPRTDAKVAFLALLCLETALPYGGTIAVGRDDGGWTIRATGRALRIDGPLWAPLLSPAAARGDRAAVSPAQVQFSLLPRELQRQGRQISVTSTETSAALRF